MLHREQIQEEYSQLSSSRVSIRNDPVLAGCPRMLTPEESHEKGRIHKLIPITHEGWQQIPQSEKKPTFKWHVENI